MQKPISPDAAAVIKAIKDSQCEKHAPWWRSLLNIAAQTLVTGIVGVVGAVIGARTAGQAQAELEQQKNEYAAQINREEKAEEVFTLIEKTPQTLIDAKRAMYLAPAHIFTPSTDSARVVALITLNFPDAVDAARAYEARCAEHFQKLTEEGINVARNIPAGNADKETFDRALAAGDVVIGEVLKELGKPYKKRVPVPPPKIVVPAPLP